MELRDHKLELGIGLLSLLLVVGLMKFFGGLSGPSPLESGNVSYEMPRPKSDMVGEFALGDREIERRHVNPFAKKPQSTGKPEAVNVQDAAKALADGQKKQRKGQWVAMVRPRPQVGVRVIDRPGRSLSTETGMSGPGNLQAPDATPQTPGTAQSEAGNAREDRLSPGQWRALLQNDPSAENMNKLVAAYLSGDVEARDFYAIVSDLMVSQRPGSKDIAFMGLMQLGDANAFRFFVAKEDEFDEIQQDQFYSAYASTSRYGALEAVLSGGQGLEVARASEVFRASLQASNGPGGTITDPRQVRGEYISQAPGQLNRFRSIFTALAESDDGAIKNLAQEILSLLSASIA